MIRERPIAIVNLADAPEHRETVARWIYREFIQGIRAGVAPEDVIQRYQTSYADALPIRLAALSGGACIGTISLVENDLRRRRETPWLASLYVDPAWRKGGVGRRLIAAVEDRARAMGYDRIYLRTEHASEYYAARGWTFIGTDRDEFGLTPDIFCKALRASE